MEGLWMKCLDARLRLVLLVACAGLGMMRACDAQRYIIADQDASGPGGSDMMSLLVLLQAPGIHLLGITIVTGDQWRDEEVAHTLRLIETVGRTDVKVYPGAAFPLLRTVETTRLQNKLYGTPTYTGAFSERRAKLAWDEIPAMPEGKPVTQPADEDAAHFMIRMVHKYPHQVTIYAAGPLTNVALACRLDPHFAELAQELVMMGGSLVPQTQADEWVNSPRHEFNFWFDPEAASIVLRAPFAKITETTVDISLKTRPDPEVLDPLVKVHSAAAEYITKYTARPVLINYLWDELTAAAWIDPSIVTGERVVYMDVNTQAGPNYGDTLTWDEKYKPAYALNKVHAQMDVDLPKLQKFLVELFSRPAPKPAGDDLTK